MSLRERITDLRERIAYRLEGDQEQGGNRKGFYVIVFVLLLLVCWPIYAEFIMERPQREVAAAKPPQYPTAGARDEVRAPAEQEEEKAPAPQAQAPRTQAPTPRPMPKVKKETEEQKMARKARLLSHYGSPLGDSWKQLAGRSDREERGEPGQVLEVPPAQQGRTQLASNGHGNGNGNGQGSVWKNDFYDRGNGQTGRLQPPESPYMVHRGSVIHVRLQDNINTQTPGQVTAVVTRDVRDSVTGRYVLIPGEKPDEPGAVVIGWPDTQLAYDQNMLPTAWDQLILPNGERMPLASFPGADRSGAAGLPVNVNTHFWKTVGRSALLTLSGAAADMTRRGGGGNQEFQDAFERQAGRQLDRRARQMWDRRGHQGPTGTVEAGEEFLLQVIEPLVFPGDYYERANGGMYAQGE